MNQRPGGARPLDVQPVIRRRVTSSRDMAARPGFHDRRGAGPGRPRGAVLATVFTGLGHFKAGPIGNALITPDGSMIMRPSAAARSRVMEMPLRPGEHASPPRAGTTGQAQAPWNVLWTNASGSTLIIAAGSSSAATGSGLGILTGGRFTPLPGTPVRTSNVAW